MDVIATRTFTLDGKRREEGKKFTVDDDTGADLIAKGFCKPKDEPKKVEEPVPETNATIQAADGIKPDTSIPARKKPA